MTTRWDDSRVRAMLPAAKRAALEEATAHVLEAANETVPIEPPVERLRDSGDTDVDGDVGTVFYTAPHAVRQHEDTRLRHDAGRRAKWLQLTVAERATAVRDFIAAELRKVFI